MQQSCLAPLGGDFVKMLHATLYIICKIKNADDAVKLTEQNHNRLSLPGSMVYSVFVHTCGHTYIHTSMHTYIHACIHFMYIICISCLLYIHADIYEYIHTYTHAYTVHSLHFLLVWCFSRSFCCVAQLCITPSHEVYFNSNADKSSGQPFVRSFVRSFAARPARTLPGSNNPPPQPNSKVLL